MAHFAGTIQEFHEYLGPRMRNKINNQTRTARLERRGICQNCGNQAELQSAHKHGRERRMIIENVLSHYENNGRIECAIQEVEKKILQAHLPIEDNFLFLCPACHRNYDADQNVEANEEPDHPRIPNQINLGANQDNNQTDFRKLHCIRLWANRPNQINHKIIRAYLSLEPNGKVFLDNLRSLCSDRKSPYYVGTFSSNYASMKTDLGHSHGRVFFEQGGIVGVYPIVREEIRRWFE